MNLPPPSLESRISLVESDVTSIKMTLEKMDRKLDSFQPGRFSLANFGVICMCILALGGVGVSYIAQATGPLAEAAQVSIKDRDLLHQAVTSNIDRIALGEARDQKFGSQLVEIETQIKGVYDGMNQANAHNTLILALLWKKSTGDDYPLVTYYPQPRSMLQ